MLGAAKENALVFKHRAERMLNVIYPHFGGPAIEGFRQFWVVFGQCINGPRYAAGIFP